MGRILERKAGSKNKSKDCGLQKPNGIFKFFFGINLSYKLYAMTDNLSKLLHSTKMPAIKGKKCADLVIYTLKSMKNDEDFDAFFEVVKKPAHPTKPAGKATLTRKQKSKIILSCHTSLATKVLRAMLITQKQPTTISRQCIFKLLTQSSVSSMIDLKKKLASEKFMNVEELLLKAINKADSSKELKVLKSNFRGDFDPNQLESKLYLIPAMFKQSTSVDFCEICKTFHDMTKNIWTVIQSVLTSGATSATI